VKVKTVADGGEFASTCQMVGVSQEVGEGHAWTKKMSIQYAALDLIHKLKLVEESLTTKYQRGDIVTQGKYHRPICKTMDYLGGNFVDLLLRYYKTHTVGLSIEFHKEEQSDKKEIETTCSLQGKSTTNVFEGIGYALSEQESKENAALDMILKFGLVTTEQHEAQEKKHQE